MDLLSGQPYWFFKNGVLSSFPALSEHMQTDVAIMGGGITGALLAWTLTEAGIPVIVIEKRHIALGSTSGSTALLQYEIDTPLTELIKLVGKKDAVRSYKLCVEAIYKVQEIVKSLGKDVNFSLKDSVYYASKKDDLPDLKMEFQERKAQGIDVEWWEQDELRSYFPALKKSAAILSHDAAQLDPYKMAHVLLNASIAKGAKVYDTVKVDVINHPKKGVTLHLDNGSQIQAGKLIIASGYESQDYISKKVTRLHSTYAIVSKPIIQDRPLWYKNALLWESARPYLYLRTTEDNRILIGGKDEMFQSARKRDKLLYSKSKQLAAAAMKMFPDLPFAIDYEWCGTFAETADGLPFIGSVSEHPNTYFALGFGGNGILFSVIAADIIRDAITGRKNTDALIFRFDRV
jgi:glycine/D-amino acid oxidase-like deaminating enzyme